MEAPEQIDLKSLKHSTLMVEKKITIKDLPEEIKARVRMIGANVSRYNSQTTKTDKFFQTITKNDLLLADAILTFLEKGLPSEDEFKKNNPNPTPDPIVKPPVQNVVTPPTPPPTPPPAPPVKSAEEIAKEEKAKEEKIKADKDASDLLERNNKLLAIDTAIMEKVNLSSNKTDISISELEKIAGKSLGDTEVTVGSKKFRKVYKQSFYRLR